MIVRELLAKFGFKPDLTGLNTFNRETDKAKRGALSAAQSIERSAGKIGGGFKGAAAETSLFTVGATGGIAALTAAAYGAKTAINDAAQASLTFGTAMGKIQSLIPGNTNRTIEYRDAIVAMSKDSGQSLEDVAAGTYDVISTFGDTAESIQQVALAVKVGAAGAATTKDGIALLSSVTKAYGDTSAATMQKVADLGFQTVNLGKVELPELAASMGIATPLAANLGVSMEELFAIMASSSGVTGTGAEVMTQTASAMQSLIKKTPEMKKAWRKVFGKEGVKDAVSKDGLIGVFKKLAATTDGSIEQIDALFGRIEGFKGVLQLTGKGAADFQDKLHSMGTVAGATDVAFAAMRGGMAAAATKAKQTEARVAALKVQIGDELTGGIEDAKSAMVTFAEDVAKHVLPSMQAWNTDAMNPQAMDDFKFAAEAVGDVLIIIAETVDVIVTGLASIGDLAGTLGALGVAAWNDDLKGAQAIIGASWDSQSDRWGRQLKRGDKRWTAITDPERAKNEAGLKLYTDRVRNEKNAGDTALAQRFGFSSGATQVQDNKITGNTFTIQVAAGTTQEFAADASKQLAVKLQQEMRQASANAPNRTNPSGTEDAWGVVGSNNRFQE